MFEELEDMSMLSDDQVNALFEDTIEVEEKKDDGAQEPSKEKPEEKTKTAEAKEEDINPETLFEEPSNEPESVGSEKKKDTKDDAYSEKGIPPFSSLAKALKEEGVLLDLEDSEIEKVKTSDDFVELIEKTIQAKFDERQKRVDDAINNGVEVSVIHNYEQTIRQLDSISDEQLSEESERGENLRRQILYRDYLNKNFSEERARRAVERAFADGTDIEDAKDALQSIKDLVQSQYQAKLDEAKAEEDAIKEQRLSEAKELRKGLLEDKEVFGDLEIDKATRQKALDAILKPVYQDPKTGNKYTAIQYYEKTNSVDFLKKVGLIYAMTDGFKNVEGLVGKKVKKEVSKGMKALEEKINNSRRNSDGSLEFVTGAADKESFFNFSDLDI